MILLGGWHVIMLGTGLRYCYIVACDNVKYQPVILLSTGM